MHAQIQSPSPGANLSLSNVNASTARTNLGLGTAATQNTGTSANNIPQFDSSDHLVGKWIPIFESEASIEATILDAGEVAIGSDSYRVHIGDGVTLGGQDQLLNLQTGIQYTKADSSTFGIHTTSSSTTGSPISISPNAATEGVGPSLQLRAGGAGTLTGANNVGGVGTFTGGAGTGNARGGANNILGGPGGGSGGQGGDLNLNGGISGGGGLGAVNVGTFSSSTFRMLSSNGSFGAFGGTPRTQQSGDLLSALGTTSGYSLISNPTISFSDLSGNITVSQMSGGTGASLSTYWRGDQTWAALPTIPTIAITSGMIKGNGSGNAVAATADTDYQSPLALTTTGTSGAATFSGHTLNVPTYANTTYTGGTGLTLTGTTFSVNASQSISTLSNLTSNGLVKTSGGTGALSIATAGTDYPGLASANTFTGKQSFDAVIIIPVALTDGTTIATDASLGSYFSVTLGGNRTLSNPTNASDGEKIMWAIKQDATGSRTLALGTNFTFGTDLTAISMSTTASVTDYLTVIYDATSGHFRVVSFLRGYTMLDINCDDVCGRIGFGAA